MDTSRSRQGHDDPDRVGPLTHPDSAAAVAASGVGRLAATVERLRRELRDARADADADVLVAHAVGILAERLGCRPAEARRQLESVAERAGVSVAELAADIVQEVSGAPDPRADAVDADGTGDGEPRAAPPIPRPAGFAGGVITASDPQATAVALYEQALRPLGATAVAIWAVAADGSLELAGQDGFAAVEAGRWHHVPPGVGTLAQRALTARQVRWTTDPDVADAPSIGGVSGGQAAGTRVALPAETGGRVVGVLEVCWPGPVEPLPQAVHRQLDGLAALCAYPLLAGAPDGGAGPSSNNRAADQNAAPLADLVDSLITPALVLRPLRDADGRLIDFRVDHLNPRFVDPAGRPAAELTGLPLLEAYPASAREAGLATLADQVYATGKPFLSERTVITVLVEGAPVSVVGSVGLGRIGDAVVLTWRLEDESTRLARLLGDALRLGHIGGFEDNIVAGETTWNAQLFELYGLPAGSPPVQFRALPGHVHPDDSVAVGRFLRTVLHHRRPATVEVRLRRSDGVLRHVRMVAEPVADDAGLLVAIRGVCQDISTQHWTETALAATRDQLAHTEQESAERDRLALQLQHAIMPPAPTPLDVSGFDIAVRYRPAERGNLVGGDWYDAVVLPDRRVLLAVGDVAGHGIDAATDMVTLRNALRGLAVTGASPGRLLQWLNTITHYLTHNITATVVCGVYEPESRTLRWARAGHLPPVLVRGGAATALPLPGGPLLGAADDVHYEEHVLPLRPGDTLLMYTDGLIERRDQQLDESLDQLLTLARQPPPGLGDLLDHLLIHCDADTDDDTCLIAVKLT